MGDDLITEEACRARGGVSEQGLFLGELELEGLVQEGFQARFERFCFLFGSHKSQKPVSSVPYGRQAPVGGVVRVNRRELVRFVGEGVGFVQSSLLPPFVGWCHQRKVSPVLLAFLAAG